MYPAISSSTVWPGDWGGALTVICLQLGVTQLSGFKKIIIKIVLKGEVLEERNSCDKLMSKNMPD